MSGAEGWAALEGLPPVERAVFVLREVFAWRLPDIAAALGCSAQACRRLAAAVPGFDGGDEPGEGALCVVGAASVARLLTATVPPLLHIGLSLEQWPVDGGPGVVIRDRNGEVRGALALDFVDGRIHTIRAVPDSTRP
ncbi:sigma factor-like helix-turn-helix DNA-binding protein [Streptomyces sp. NPDC017979]|uniref:sigma factor-like helix-turn-helix DNA-binding protein n=1 Tax=Streptomyces sp. NPDC017979 TaxID=3365024 RepID=UPI0037AA0234